MKALKIILCLILSKGEVSEPNFVGKWTRLEASQFHYPVWLEIQPEKIKNPQKSDTNAGANANYMYYKVYLTGTVIFWMFPFQTFGLFGYLDFFCWK